MGGTIKQTQTRIGHLPMKIYVDSSFDEKNLIAGIGLHIEDGVKQRDISNWIPCNNNNFAELWGIYLAAILSNGKNCTIYTDSQVAIQYLTGNVKEKPRKQSQYINHQQMKVLAYKVNRLKPLVEKVKAHSGRIERGYIGNQLADILSHQGRAKFYGR